MDNNISHVDTVQVLPQTPGPKVPNIIPCASCGSQITPTSYFCSNCGRKIKDPPPSTSLFKQISVYAFAFFVPPFGIIPAIAYLKSTNPNAKIVGYFAILITVISMLGTIWLSMSFVNQLNKSVNIQQLQDFQNAGI